MPTETPTYEELKTKERVSIDEIECEQCEQPDKVQLVKYKKKYYLICNRCKIEF